MIIRQLRGENLFRFKKVEIPTFPATGLVGISGPNEAGKSALLEAVCLALFGRTYSLTSQELAKVVRWGETTASVYLGFSARNGREYSVTRYIDVDGSQRARLAMADSGDEVAKGVAEVDQAVLEVLGYDFRSFVDTFYQPQRLGGWERADSATIKVLAGVAPVEETTRLLAEQEIIAENGLVEGEAEIQTLGEQLRTLNVKEEALGKLQQQRGKEQARADAEQKDMEGWNLFAADLDRTAQGLTAVGEEMLTCDDQTPLAQWRERQTAMAEALKGFDGLCDDCHVEMEEDPTQPLRKWQADLGERLSALEEILGKVDHYRQGLAAWLGGRDAERPCHALELKTIQQRRGEYLSRRGRLRLFTSLFVVMALVMGGVGGALSYLPDFPMVPMVQALLLENIPGWQPDWNLVLMALGGVLLVLGLSFLFRSRADSQGVAACDRELIHLDARRLKAEEEIKGITAAAAISLTDRVTALRRLNDPVWVADLARWLAEDGVKLLDDDGRRTFLNDLGKRLKQFREEIAALQEDVAISVREAGERRQGLLAEIQGLDEAIRGEEARRRQDRELRGRLDHLQQRMASDRRAIAVRQHARRLLIGAGRELANLFNDELRRYVSTLAPLFTQGRYQHLKIDTDLSVQAFSLEKNDFVDFNEVSNGVRHQLTLAVRVAMAQALLARSQQGPQCLMLDEPFAFFDPQRQKQTLESLRQVGGDLGQFLVIFQELPAKFPFDLALSCPRDGNVLDVGPSS